MDNDAFAKCIFISNAVPKSGSTFLFEYQKALFVAAGAGSDTIALLERRGVPHVRQYVEMKDNAAFLELLNDRAFAEGPLVIKTHSAVTEELRTAVLENSNVFMSMIIRDPQDVLLSAMDNHRNTGEFWEFRELESGLRTVNGHFLNILKSVRALNRELKGSGRATPVSRYVDLLDDPAATALGSLPVRLRTAVAAGLARRAVSGEAIEKRSAHRKQKGERARSLDAQPAEAAARIKAELAETRRIFGYMFHPG